MNAIRMTGLSKPLYFRVKKYLLVGLIFTTIIVYIFFIFYFASKMNTEEVKKGNSELNFKDNFKPLTTNTNNVSVSRLKMQNRK